MRYSLMVHIRVQNNIQSLAIQFVNEFHYLTFVVLLCTQEYYSNELFCNYAHT